MSPRARDTVLEVSNLRKDFGGLKALDGISFKIDAGEILGLAGPNGSGKTTCINAITGVFHLNEGEIRFLGSPIQALPTYKRVRLGLNRSFQVPAPFPGLTVLENVTVAANYGGGGSQNPETVLEQVGLLELRDRIAGSLNSSQQKLLDLGRALATGPKLLLVDEIGAGLNPGELGLMAERLRALADSGMALMVVEHLMDFLDRVTDRVLVMDSGRELFSGRLSEAVDDSRVVEAFLGG